MSKARLGLIGLTALASAAGASAPPPFAGEQLRWEIHDAGVSAGIAWASARSEGAAVVIEGGARNASWYAAFYTINDTVRSTWIPGRGSVRYETRFREGDFHQDQDMHLDPSGNAVLRHQEIDGAWKTWTDASPAAGAAEDPVSAMYALRRETGPGPWTVPVFSGRLTWPLLVRPLGAQRISTLFGLVPVDALSLEMAHKGEVEQRGRFLVYLTQDAARIPVRMEIAANIGTIRADLIGYRAPDGRTWGEVEPR